MCIVMHLAEGGGAVDIARTFLNKGMVLVPFDAEKELARATPLLLDLMGRSKARNRRLSVAVPGNNLGYYSQDGSGGKDIRESFYFNRLLLPELRKRGTALTRKEKLVLETCEELYVLSLAKAREIGALLDATGIFEGRSLCDAMLDPEADHLHALRFLLYPEELPPERGTLLARPHPDRGALSLALKQRCRGLIRIYPDGREEFLDLPLAFALAFPGSKFSDWMDGDPRFPAMPHKVERADASEGRRWSWVFFCHIPDRYLRRQG